MPRDLLDLAASAQRTAQGLELAQAQGVKAAALLVTTSIRTEIRTVTGDMRLSGVGKKGARVGAQYDLKGAKNPTALVKAVGPLHLIERDTQAHLILPKGYQFGSTRKGNVRRRGKGTVLKMRGGGFAAYAEHPGTRGKHPFERGWKRAEPEAPVVFQRKIQALIQKEWF